jgi:hypothetical protein
MQEQQENSTVAVYRGRPLEELTREELIDAVKDLGRAYHELLNNGLNLQRAVVATGTFRGRQNSIRY